MYTVTLVSNGAVYYYNTDSEPGARYLAGVLTGDLINGQVRTDCGMTCLYNATVQDGVVVRARQPDGSMLTPSPYG